MTKIIIHNLDQWIIIISSWLTIATIENSIKLKGKAIEEEQDDNKLAILDTELEELELLKIEMEMQHEEI